MQILYVAIEKNGQQIPVGTIEADNYQDACFHYNEEFEEKEHPISISLPFGKGTFPAEQTRNFFEGLLPEGFTRRSVAQWVQADENDYLSLLRALGKECLGAIRIADENISANGGYEKLKLEQVKALAAEGATKSTEIVVKTHLSLTGASGKVGLYYDEPNSTWYLPTGNSPSTHIVKQSHVRLKNVVVNEQLCMLTAAKLGIDVPQSFIVNTGSGNDGEVLFATKRYDRMLPDAGAADISGGLVKPYRLHQEDFAMAGGIAASRKYEREGGAYLKLMLDILRKYSSNPVSDQRKLWEIVIFDWMIGNTDAHIKNFSLIYGPGLDTIRLAPAYDIMSTVIYPESTGDMSFRIGNHRSINAITRDDFIQAAQETQTGKRVVLSALERLSEKFEAALGEAVYELKSQGFDQVTEIREKILENAGCRK